MKKLIICYGPERSGKTSFSKTKTNYTRIRFDDYWRQRDYSPATKSHGFDYVKLQSDLISTFSKSEKVILDGWMRWDELHSVLKEVQKVTSAEICIYLIVTNVVAMADRRIQEIEKKKLVVTPRQNYEMYKVALKYVQNFPYPSFVLNNNNLDYSRISSTITPEDFEKLCYPQINFEKADKFISGLGQLYHGIEVGTRKYGNFSHCEEVWKHISSKVNFVGKSVLDLGCYYGFFTFRAEENMARKSVGYDIGGLVNSCNRIARYKNSKSKFENKDLDTLSIKEKWDTILVMNVLHHLNAPLQVLNEVFKSANKSVVVGIDIPESPDLRSRRVVEVGGFLKRAQKGRGVPLWISVPVLEEFAKEYGFKRVAHFNNSRKANRKLFIYSK